MLEKTTRRKIKTDTFHCDFQHRLNISHLGNSMLNVADTHSTERQFGMTYLNTINKTWVLSRLAIELEDMPTEHAEFYIETWVENAMRYFTRRNWAIYSTDGATTYGYGKSIWAMIDTVERTPQDILAVDGGRISQYLCKDKECPIKDVSRVTMPNLTKYSEFRITYNDIDVNGHCNSMKYLDHVMDTFPRQHYEKYQLKRVEMAYVAEGHWGELVRVYTGAESDYEHNFRLVTLQDGGIETEVCRMKVKFIDKVQQ